MAFRLTTWNVNGIRNPFGYQPWREKRTFQAMFDILEADIVVIQETKIQQKDLQDDMVLVPGWDVFFSLPKHKKGYSGVAIYTRNSTCAPIRAEEGVTGILTSPKSTTRYRDLPEHQQIGGYPRPGQLDGIIDEATLDSEGRCVILEFPGFVLFGVYSPANRDETRDDFRVGFFQALDVRIRNLVAAGKEVILTGDLNVVRSEMDSTNVAETLRKENIDPSDWMNMPVRRIFNQLIFEGSVLGGRDQGHESPVLWDLCRCFHPERVGMNTCWDTKRNTRPANNGSRIDYVLCSNGIKSWFSFSNIQEGLMGSDHCPVFAAFTDKVIVAGEERALLEMMNPPGMFQGERRLRDWSAKDLLPLSARLIPEFDRRQSIRDMFTKKATSAAPPPASAAPGVAAKSSMDGDCSTEKVADKLNGTSEPQTTATFTPQLGDTTGSTKQSFAHKRPGSAADTANRPLKKTKSTIGAKDLKAKVAPAQRTLQGFFKPKAPVVQDGKSERVVASSTPSLTKKPILPKTGSASPQQPPSVPQAMFTKGSPLSISRGGDDPDSSDKVFDPIEAKESWSKLLRKRAAPRCEHDEPCISFTTKKPGVNCGTSHNGS
ncbi:Endonuclease/exonuclease/phosphatase [Fusarium flagelliforme]|uniref:Endonuclease/exonuclease/phosphatase n=1 Tax=Fusarium flagelliforme TaxID=2675880 RepID=UPI001E8ECEF3|nr:Endonuclease/exonuclease/phosphatase [Fusarium flagelliforme]KAH7185335.1 Endonuclease/exonuclease/phosphatase [Fusarium flagelliforme]